MDVIELVQQVRADGLHLHVLPNGNLKVSGLEPTCEKWLEQIKANKLHIIPLLTEGLQEFEDLFRFISPLAKWNEKDYQAWLIDYMSTPDEVLRCLRALRCSWKEGRYGYLLSSDWMH